MKNASDPEIAKAWQDAFRSLLRSEFLGSETIPSFDGHRIFRLFVTRRISFFSGIEEYYIYVLPERETRTVWRPTMGVTTEGTVVKIERTNEPPSISHHDSGHEVEAGGPVHIFISYKHVDHKIVDDVRNHLGWLENAEKTEIFDDRDIRTGESWNERILNELRRADIIVLLVSAAFMRSPYCTKIELREALNLRSARGVVVIPIIVETCDWDCMPLRSIAALPKDKDNNLKPLNKWYRDRDVALTQIAKQIREHVEKLAHRR